MTTAQIAARKDRWLRAVGYGFLAEFATVLTIILIVQVYARVFSPGLTSADFTALGQRVGIIAGTVGGTLYTYLFARLLMPRLAARFIEHGAVVALTAIAFSVAGSIAGHQGVPSGYILASALKLSTGALAGFLYSRSVSLNRNVV
ncbi:MAG: hypothetical protein M3037_15690 [Gemmatimonadota bacterium]|nr:hypothetical protein [Gemmatimonadota bacterium]